MGIYSHNIVFQWYSNMFSVMIPNKKDDLFSFCCFQHQSWFHQFSLSLMCAIGLSSHHANCGPQFCFHLWPGAWPNLLRCLVSVGLRSLANVHVSKYNGFEFWKLLCNELLTCAYLIFKSHYFQMTLHRVLELHKHFYVDLSQYV
jgi:hypothetical protein